MFMLQGALRYGTYEGDTGTPYKIHGTREP